MTLVVIFLVFALVLVLTFLEFVTLRRLERDQSPLVRDARVAPAHGLALALGYVGYPGALIPVVLTVTALRPSGILSDGHLSLLCLVVAAFAMSASAKALRIAEFTKAERKGPILTMLTTYHLVWAMLITVLGAGGLARLTMPLLAAAAIYVVVLFVGGMLLLQKVRAAT